MNASDKFAATRLISVHIGRIAPLGPDAVASGFVKERVDGRQTISPAGVAGDEQADLSVHGGIDKAVYGYAADHYPAWTAAFPQHADRFIAGSMGENLAIVGITESDVHLGDIIRHGTAVLQVTQPRQPCFKLALAFGAPPIVRAMTRSGRSGWYYRVIAPGTVAAGDALALVDRPNPEWSIARFNAGLLTAFDAATLAALAQLPGLASDWHARFAG
ncbi:MAG: MOSC domain-containing protein [Polymorphobacter sp.]